jgi:hypothetical protein
MYSNSSSTPPTAVERGQRDNAETGEPGIALAGRGGDTDAQGQHERHRDGSGGHRTRIPGQAQGGGELRLRGGVGGQGQHRRQCQVDHRLQAPAIEEAQRADDRGQTDTGTDDQYQGV